VHTRCAREANRLLLRQGPSFAGPDFTLSFGNISQCAQPLTVASVAAASAPRARPAASLGHGLHFETSVAETGQHPTLRGMLRPAWTAHMRLQVHGSVQTMTLRMTCRSTLACSLGCQPCASQGI